MKDTYHLARITETWKADGTSELGSQQIGPDFDNEVTLYHYVMAVLPAPLRTDVEVVHQYGKPNAYGLREEERTDLHDWMKRQEYQR